jgi:hypothetical protein
MPRHGLQPGSGPRGRSGSCSPWSSCLCSLSVRRKISRHQTRRKRGCERAGGTSVFLVGGARAGGVCGVCARAGGVVVGPCGARGAAARAAHAARRFGGEGGKWEMLYVPTFTTVRTFTSFECRAAQVSVTSNSRRAVESRGAGRAQPHVGSVLGGATRPSLYGTSVHRWSQSSLGQARSGDSVWPWARPYAGTRPSRP